MSEDPQANKTNTPGPPTCPPFDHRKLGRQLWIDSLARWSVMLIVCVSIVAGSIAGIESMMLSMALVILISGAWIGLSMVNARSWHEVRQLPALIEANPEMAEHQLATCLKRWPLQRTVRLLLYHRLAMLRHRQQRYAETAAICGSLLAQRLRGSGGAGGSERIRQHLLLMLVEACITQQDYACAYAGLLQLHDARLNLIESVQRMALQTRYEIECGHHHQALAGLAKKIQLAELMPAPQCGAIHAMFAVAADRSEQPSLAKWLSHRAELLCESEQLDEMNKQVGFLDIPDNRV